LYWYVACHRDILEIGDAPSVSRLCGGQRSPHTRVSANRRRSQSRKSKLSSHSASISATDSRQAYPHTQTYLKYGKQNVSSTCSLHGGLFRIDKIIRSRAGEHQSCRERSHDLPIVRQLFPQSGGVLIPLHGTWGSSRERQRQLPTICKRAHT
jgi:hypothetical protein